MQRRSFLASILAAGVAPAYVGASVLMPVRRIIPPPELVCPRQHLYLQSRSLVAGQEIVFPAPASGGELRLFTASGALLATVKLNDTSTLVENTGVVTAAQLRSPLGRIETLPVNSLHRGEGVPLILDWPAEG